MPCTNNAPPMYSAAVLDYSRTARRARVTRAPRFGGRGVDSIAAVGDDQRGCPDWATSERKKRKTAKDASGRARYGVPQLPVAIRGLGWGTFCLKTMSLSIESTLYNG
ncbi:hypothetical protein EVAR_9420_1 [Eumeta japonica]|uniref:Uncharacterized protein n=1 Tax=Eumeta variegata TaxID=151549 RepID=A0A4C1UEB9_EUMVA|nr:hypothetical protein EVAR_9420_1 [Eumeta japonica]